jgi:hypothetical protein
MSILGRVFSKPPLLDAGTTEWIFDTCAWVLTEFGTDAFYAATQLVTPTDEFFPSKSGGSPDALAQELFDAVKRYADMEQWPCRLEAQEEDAMKVVAPTVVVSGAPSGPAGTFSVQDESVVITYNPAEIDRPESLIATFAHELAHYLSFSTAVRPPGGEDFEEHATDLLAVFFGFGIFLTNSVFHFEQYTDVDSQGWSSRSQGYLGQDELLYSTAIFCELKGIESDDVLPHLQPHYRSFFKKARREILGLYADELVRLRQIRSGQGAASEAE